MFFWISLVSLIVLIPNYFKENNSGQFVELNSDERKDIDVTVWNSRVSTFSMLNLKNEGPDLENFAIAFIIIHVNTLISAIFLRKFMILAVKHNKRNYSHEKMRSEHTVMVQGLPSKINLDAKGKLDMEKVRSNRKQLVEIIKQNILEQVLKVRVLDDFNILMQKGKQW